MEVISYSKPLYTHLRRIASYRYGLGRIFNQIFWRHKSHYYLDDLLIELIKMHKEVCWRKLIEITTFNHSHVRYMGIMCSTACRACTYILIDRHQRGLTGKRTEYVFTLVVEHENVIETSFQFRPSYPVQPKGEKIDSNLARRIHELFLDVHAEFERSSSSY